mmetsp:Transcript_3926/g.5992  ORF Transcript_3926/g.5992 Transcript_3926/m.5992 type:complete len:507 (+) Transcript_3926:89-1609(+)
MGKRPNETDEERAARKARKKAKKEKRKLSDETTKEIEKKKKNESKKEVKKKSKTKTTTVVVDKKDETNSSDDAPSDQQQQQVVSWNSFSEAPFEASIQKALSNAGFEKPSPIQARAWPVALSGKDIIAVAKTGSGKTLGFLLPIFHRISTNDVPNNNGANGSSESGCPSPKALVISPTRELAIQIHGECVKFGDRTIGITSTCLYGGTKVHEQIQALRKLTPEMAIATPGRLCDILNRKPAVLSLNKCHFVVLDEADRMLDMGFEPQLKKITAALPDKAMRQTLFFTATWPKAVRKVAARFLKSSSVEIFLGEGTADGELVANKAVKQTFVEAQDDEKDRKLYNILCGLDENSSVVIFANTKRRVDFVAKMLWQEGFTSCAVHGDKAQHERDASLKKFVAKECSILVATDVAARGLDIKGVTHVINFDMARDCDSYVHRIGRTGRAGEVGDAITFWNPDYDKPCSPAWSRLPRTPDKRYLPFCRNTKRERRASNGRLPMPPWRNPF